MSSINLVHRYVVEQLLSINTKCEFKNYGGTSSGLIDRIMASFHIPETGHIQTFYYGNTNKRLNTTAIKTFIKTKIIADQLDDVIDIWKEICNKGFSESMIMGYASDIELVLITRGLSSNQFLNLAIPTFPTKLKTVDNAIKSANDYLEKVIGSKTSSEFNNYKEKLLRTLVTYPYIQKVFIENNFPETFLGQLEVMPNATLRSSALITKIKEDNIARLKEVKSAEAKEGTRKMSEAMKRMHPPAEPYIQFMGTEHLTAPVFNWASTHSRFSQECSLIAGLMGSLSNGDKSVIGTIKALIHRSPNQKALCRDIFILPTSFPDFDSYDRRKRGMILDEILDKVGDQQKVQIKKDPLSSFPEYPNLTEEEEHVSQPKVNVPDNQEAEIIKDLSNILKHYSTEMPTDPETMAIINSLIEKLESRPTFKSRLTQNLDKQRTGLDRVDDFLNAVANEAGANPKLLHALAIQEVRRKNGTCDNLDWTMCGEKNADIILNFLKTKYPAVDLIVGIMPDHDKPATSYIRPDAGKQRSEGQHDFNGLLRFLDNYHDPEPKKPTVTEIETSTNVVINQKFVVYDVKGEFFCEYKMNWTPTRTRFMFTHDEPGSEAGRRFHLIHEFNKQMTQDEAFAQFQSLRRAAISNGPHK